MKRFTTYTDESGIPSKKKFIVATAIVDTITREEFEELLEQIEKRSGKNRKWTDVGVIVRSTYTQLLINKGVFKLCTIYYTIYNNKADYVPLVSSHVAKSIINYSNNEEYKATIFLDKVNNRITREVQNDIKRYKVRFKKLKSLDDTNSVGLKFIDAICGLVRDIDNKGIDSSYKKIYLKLKSI